MSHFFYCSYLSSQVELSDEREELIRLKSSELAHRMMMGTLTIMALLFLIFPTMHAFYPIMATIVSAMYGEIFGKLFFRWKL